jgi:hypothetical protein
MTETAVATAADEIVEPDIYDSLGQTGQDVWDLIGSYGFRPDKDTDAAGETVWFALETQGDRVIGPFKSLSALGLAVEDETGDGRRETGDAEPEVVENVAEKKTLADYATSFEGENQATEVDSVEVEIDEDHKGNTYLPGVKPIVDEQLAQLAGAFHADNNDWKDAGKKRKGSLAALEAGAAIKRSLFHQDPDNDNSLIYHAGGLKIRIAKESKTKVTVEEDEDE